VSIGRDVREAELVMRPAPVLGGLEPELLTERRQQLLDELAGHAASFTPEWTDRRPDDAGVAIAKVHATLLETAHRRLNRLPRRLALDYLDAAGVRALAGTPALALGAIEVGEGAPGPIEVASGTVFLTQEGPSGPVLETTNGCSALPGRPAALAVLAGGWLSLDQLTPPYGVQPFGVRPHPPAELWLGLELPATPAGSLSLGVRLLLPPGRAAADSVADRPIDPPPLLRWEAMTAAGAVELALEFDGTRGLAHTGVIAFRVPAGLAWTPALRTGQTGGTPLRWLRARLLTSIFPAEVRLREILLNGVGAVAARSVRDEIAEPVDRPATGGSRYRLAQVPVLPGSVVVEVAESAGLAAADTITTWSEIPSLAAAQPDDRVFTLDPATGILSFGDGFAGRAVPEGYRNVVARVYRTGGGTAGLPRPGDLLAPELSVPDLTGLRVAAITTGSAAETATDLLRRGPAVIRSRRRAVAAADYGTAALATPGVDIARAHCLPGLDPTAAGAQPGTLGVVVVPHAATRARPPSPDPDTLQAVADHLAGRTGVAGARVVAVAPRYREVSVQGVLVGATGWDLARLVSTARDRIDDWLSPLTGGDGSGWPFGEPVRWNALVRMLLERVPGLEAAAQVSFGVDGRRLAACADVALAQGELVWPGTHLLEAVPVTRGGAG
jgi:predicted phage baseplate assembly protein